MLHWIWNAMAWSIPVLFVFLFATAWLEVRWLLRLHRAVGALEGLAVLSFAHSWEPIYTAWCRSMGDMHVVVQTRRYSFSFDPAGKKRDAAP
jgi:hypothetical protein